MRIVYFGSDDFSLSVLKHIYNDHHTIVALVTTPGAPKGRGRVVQHSPVRLYADEHTIPCYEPQDIHDHAFRAQLESYQADLFVVVSYGKILSDEILSVPRLYTINVHPSLLPKYRGPSPVQYALLNGDRETGVSIIKLNRTVDGGDILYQERIPLSDSITAPELFVCVAEYAGRALLNVCDAIDRNAVTFSAQCEREKSYARRLRKEDGEIKWQQPAEVIHNQVRALQPWPSTYTLFQGRMIKIVRAHCVYGDENKKNGVPGTIELIKKNGELVVRTGAGLLAVEELQPEGKKVMRAWEWANGQRVKEGECFG